MKMKETVDTEREKQISFDRICQALFDSAAEGLAVVDVEGKIKMANSRLEDMFGYAPNTLLGQPVDILVPTRHAASHVKHREAYNNAPTRRSMGIGMDLSGKRKDGSEFPVEISLNHFQSEGESYVMALISDITQRKAAEVALESLNQDLEQMVQARTRELKASQNMYGIIARNFPNGTINVFDRDFNYVFAEGRELFRMGVTSAELVGTNYLKRLDPSVQEMVATNLNAVFEGNNQTFNLEFAGKFYELHAVPLRDAEGLVDQILVVENNVTQQKKAEVNMLQTLEKERKLNELKSRFVSMASHEFRTPLSTILSSLSLLTRYNSPEHAAQRDKHFGRIKSSVHNLTGILNDFLSLDKLESGLILPNYERLNIKALVEEVVDDLRQSIAKKGQEISFDFEGEELVDCDSNMIRNITTNLLSNAIKYSAENKAIEIKVAVIDGIVRINVKDNGIGIPDGDKEHMFERFFRAKNATNIAGTGLGLNIVKKYLDILGGDIWFDSVYGEGTTFFVAFPQFVQ